MNRRDPPGRRGADPPGERIYHAAPVLSSQRTGRKDDADDDDDNSDQTVSRNDLDDDEHDEEEDEKDLGHDVVDDVQGSLENTEQGSTTSKEVADQIGSSVATRDSQDGTEHGADPILDFEPSYTKANAISFHILCTRLEKMWLQRNRKTNRQSKNDVFLLLIDDSLRAYLHGTSSWFPLLRLVMPDIDTSRPHSGMKERNIALAWGEAFDLTKGSRPFERLLNFNDPTHFGTTNAASDLSLAVQEIVELRDGTKGSNLKLKHVNDLLDELVAHKRGPIRGNHDWRDSGGEKKKGPSIKQKRCEWVKKLRTKQLSALEHKWVVRILLQKMEIGFSSKTMLSRWMPGGLAIELYRMNNNLKSVCTTLSNPFWLLQREEREKGKQQSLGKMTWMERTKGEAVLGNTIAPMLALKVYFRDAMAELCRSHRAYGKKELRGSSLLPLKNPAIICEVKLDGERMVVHVKRGTVTMHTRRGRWYSDLYSPVLAPCIRRAIAKWDVDLILDGEVVAWDDGKQETVPFGNNRTIALARERWMDSHGLLEERDKNLHEDQTDLNVMMRAYHDGDVVESIAGSECWLRYEVFDVLYVGGPAAVLLISTAAGLPNEAVEPGSIIHLNGFQRKRILHHLITPQEKELVLVPALVIRPNGVAVKAEEYFSPTNPTMEKGYQASYVDSIEWGLDASDEQREIYDYMRGRFSDTELGLLRAEAADRFYADIVDARALEGILLKDLNAYYLLEGRKYWCKHKPDYEENSELGDIDLIILGAFHGTGMGPSGKLNGFLCGCVDDEDPHTFVAVVKVNGGSVSRDVSDQMLASTGYKKQTDTEPWDTGKWFREENHGKSFPDFIARRSFQYKDGRTPVFGKKKYPDLWIHPEDSIVLTLKASEIVATDGFQAGITLRFPRIERVRLRDTADDKDAQQVETLEGLHRAYREQMQRREGSGEIEFQSGSVTPGRANRRFQTAEEGLRKKIASRNTTDQGPAWTMPIADRKESSALDGLDIAVLEGVYSFDEKSLDAEESKEQGWFDLAKGIKSRDDLLLFISKHGGNPKISISHDTDFVIGGRSDDSRVVMHHKGLENGLKERGKRKTGLTSEHMMKIGGVLKWTFIVSVVHVWKLEIETFKAEPGQDIGNIFRSSSIKSTHPHLLKPTPYQYLVPTWAGTKGGDNIFGISKTEVCTLIAFKRSLEEVANEAERDRAKRTRPNTAPSTILPWQYNARDVEMMWSLGGKVCKLWPTCGQHSPSNTIIVVYPDLFDLDFGERGCSSALEHVKSGQVQERWQKVSSKTCVVASCIPLARAMGAQVTPHLHNGVTHVLCELKQDLLRWRDFDAQLFQHPTQANRIKTRLSGMHKGPCDVTFVSPGWVRSQWEEQQQS